jgi:hypothetical protein
VLPEVRRTMLGPRSQDLVEGDSDAWARAGGILAAVLLVAYALFANPISGLALQGAVAAGAR